MLKSFKRLSFHHLILSSSLNSFRSCASDTIFALSSGQGKCGVAVIRVSGPSSRAALKLVTNFSDLPNPRTSILRSIVHPQTQEVLDKGLVLWFPGPRSFTGEDSFELQVHGGLAVINAVLSALGSIPKLRLAEPGEFTKRAFHNSKLDLTEVEGLADLLQAETEFQRKQAFLQTHGSLSKLYNKWKTTLIKCVANVEATIDFDETDTIEHDLMKVVTEDVKQLCNDLEIHLSNGHKGEILRNGVKSVILGEPNTGKSSLLNILCKRPAAIVTPIEGTTRDVLEVTLNINGYPLVLADTAGLRSQTQDIVEKEGIHRALQLYEKSDLVLLIIDANKYITWKNKSKDQRFIAYLKEYVEKLNLCSLINSKADNFQQLFTKQCLIVLNKTDLTKNETLNTDCEGVVLISCKTEDGICKLVQSVSQRLKILCGEPSHDHPSMNQQRHRQHLTDCKHYLSLFLKEYSSCSNQPDMCPDLVLMAEHLRKALRHLGKLVGTVTTDNLLDVIFRDFCIGK